MSKEKLDKDNYTFTDNGQRLLLAVRDTLSELFVHCQVVTLSQVYEKTKGFNVLNYSQEEYRVVLKRLHDVGNLNYYAGMDDLYTNGSIPIYKQKKRKEGFK